MHSCLKWLEFVGLLVDLGGLMILLSADVPSLSFLADYVPGVRSRKQTLNCLKAGFSLSAINPESNVSYRWVFDLTGKEASAVLDLFPAKRAKLAPVVSVSRSIEDNPGNTGSPDPLVKFTLSNDPNEVGLTRPLPRSELERPAEKTMHDVICPRGFRGMLVGAILQIIVGLFC